MVVLAMMDRLLEIAWMPGAGRTSWCGAEAGPGSDFEVPEGAGSVRRRGYLLRACARNRHSRSIERFVRLLQS
ncbi:hypothetical protein GCM10010298_28730 [Streptomyces microflavus]|uniref:Uncharacterized protein n=1 Tax=Streptomyces microflavus TaxID=1919 RepID=A0A7J0CYD1_STRMI|nr:hypothetical protein Smic_59640 [Streptomyces microflavus]GGX62327.1 hypothetical protein GCM10010298_28730 [Streptomyces microflavus]